MIKIDYKKELFIENVYFLNVINPFLNIFLRENKFNPSIKFFFKNQTDLELFVMISH